MEIIPKILNIIFAFQFMFLLRVLSSKNTCIVLSKLLSWVLNSSSCEVKH